MSLSINRQLKVFFCCSLILALAQGAHAQSTMKFRSSAFIPNSAIPKQFTCDGQDISPPLAWRGVPKSAKSLAMIMDDPDAPNGTFVHWVVYNLPPATKYLDTNVPKTATIKGGGQQGRNGTGKDGYKGPCPPAGAAHHYHFKLFALDTELKLDPGATADKVEAATKDHVVATGEVVGTYQR